LEFPVKEEIIEEEEEPETKDMPMSEEAKIQFSD
jgi:hypothetical protein